MASNRPIFTSGHVKFQREPRTSVMLGARIWSGRCIEPTTHRLLNISPKGACIAQATALSRGDMITIQIGSMDIIAASVAWSREGIAGLRFAELIDIDAARQSRIGGASGISAGWVSDLRDVYRG